VEIHNKMDTIHNLRLHWLEALQVLLRMI